MPRTCTVCRHAERQAIDEALVAQKASIRDIARQYRVSKDAIARHKAHVSAALQQAEAAKGLARSVSLLDEINTQRDRLEGLLETGQAVLAQAMQTQDLKACQGSIRVLVGVLREIRSLLELKGTASGELGREPEAARRVVIVMPLPVPAGTCAPLYPNPRFPEPEVIDVEALQAPPPETPEPPTAH